jgi:hypothetical protein
MAKKSVKKKKQAKYQKLIVKLRFNSAIKVIYGTPHTKEYWAIDHHYGQNLFNKIYKSFEAVPRALVFSIVVPENNLEYWENKLKESIKEFLSKSIENLEKIFSYSGRREERNECTCGNPTMGLDCICDFLKQNPGSREFSCEYCGSYNASKPRCNACDEIFSGEGIL